MTYRSGAGSIVLEDVFRSELVADDTACPAVIEVPSGAAVAVHLIVEFVEAVEVTARPSCNGKPFGGKICQVVAGVTSLELRFEIGDRAVVLDGHPN